MTICIIIIVLSIIFLFFIINNIILYKKEHFMKLKSGKVCGQFNDTCRLNQYNVSSCCKGYYCGLKLGKYKSKVCIPIKNITNSTSIGSLEKNPLGIINIPDQPKESDTKQIQDANMGSEVTEEESEELYYELFLALVDNIAVIMTGRIYEYELENEKKNKKHKKHGEDGDINVNIDIDVIPVSRYQSIYSNMISYLTNYINSVYSLNKSNRKNIKHDYLMITNNNSDILDLTTIDHYRTLFSI